MLNAVLVPRAAVLRAVLALAVMVAMAVVAALSGHEVRALGPCAVDHQALDAEERAFLGLLNGYRAEHGLAPLALSTPLSRSAAWGAEDMATKGYFSHTDSLGRLPTERAGDCGYIAGAGENIAAGSNWDTAAAAFAAWKASPGHNANMLNADYRVVGIARFHLVSSKYGWYWSTGFGLEDDGTAAEADAPAPPPADSAPGAAAPIATPVIDAISLAWADAGMTALTITVTGSGFDAAGVAFWGGAARHSTVASGSELVMVVSVADIAGPGPFSITVANPGAPASAPFVFTLAQ